MIELRRTAADLLGSVSSYADEMLDYILERVPEAGAVNLRGRQHEVLLAVGDNVLESALKAGLEAP